MTKQQFYDGLLADRTMRARMLAEQAQRTYERTLAMLGINNVHAATYELGCMIGIMSAIATINAPLPEGDLNEKYVHAKGLVAAAQAKIAA